MSNHIHYPGFQLLSLVNPSGSSAKSFLDTPCVLPDQYGIYTSLYLPFFIFSFIVLLVLNFHRRRQGGVYHIEPLVVSSPKDGSSHDSIHNSPLADSESCIWSPYTPAAPVSPRGVLPSSLRMFNGHSSPATFRASRPATPVGSPFLTPAVYPPEEDDESMYPTQYAMRRDSRSQDDATWSSERERISPDSQMQRSTYAPSWKSVATRGWSWSWTFVFRGRRRRVTLRVPELSEVRGWLSRNKQSSTTHCGILRMTVMDGFKILWPVVLLWILVTWWMS
jgi:hypothetical protein